METPFVDFDRREWQTVESGTLEFALVGLGWWTREFVLPAIESTSLARTTTVVSGSADKRQQAIDEYETVTTGLDYEAFEAGEAADEYDAVYVCTPNAVHQRSVAAAAERGAAILVEKPMEATVESAREIVETVDATGAPTMVAYRMHTEPLVRYGRRLIREGVIGDPRLVHGKNNQLLLDINDDPGQWRLHTDLSGYGTSVMDLGIYPLNTARFLLDADPVAVRSAMGSDHEAFADVPDEYATFEVEYEGDVLAAFAASQNAADGSRLEIVGTEGTIRFEPAFHMETELTVEKDGVEYHLPGPDVDQMAEEFAYFANQVLAEDPFDADARHGLQDMLAIEAIHEAAARGERVTVPEV
ncbi:MAG: D-xylose 1-dehydrogenase Gfo6 [Halanaeroarchaeum sp.]